MISTYFTTKSLANGLTKKRPSSPIDLTADDDHAPFKKARTTFTVAEVADSQVEPSRIESHAADRWRYSQSPSPLRRPEPLDDSTPAQVAARRARHEAFKKKLLGENNTLFRKRSGRDDDAIDVDVDTNLESNAEKQRTDRMDESGDDSDAAFRDLRDMFSHGGSKRKSSVKATNKTRSSAVRKKTDEEIGPCGQTYTPLEKQVCGIVVGIFLCLFELLFTGA
jgi:DNA mismatch repair protein MSH3